MTELAGTDGKRFRANIERFVLATNDDQYTDLVKSLLDRLPPELRADIPSVLVGALLGSMPTTHGNFFSIMRDWIRRDDSWRVQDQYLAARTRRFGEFDAAIFVLEKPWVVDAMTRRPVPDRLQER